MKADEIRNVSNSSGSTSVSSDWGAQWPERLLCPSFKYIPNPWDHKVSFGYNIGRRPAGKVGYELGDIRGISAGKLMFADAQSWWIYRDGADYKRFWDVLGENVLGNSNQGETCYRHSEKTNVAYFDGHAGPLAKEEAFRYDPPGSSTPDNNMNNKLWFIDKL